MLSSSPKRADLNKLLRIDQACLQSYDRKDEIAIGIHSGSRISLVREKYKPCTEQTKARTLTLSERRMRLCPTKGLLGGPKLASGRLLPVNAHGTRFDDTAEECGIRGAMPTSQEQSARGSVRVGDDPLKAWRRHLGFDCFARTGLNTPETMFSIVRTLIAGHGY